MYKIVIFGNSGSGKSTLSKQLKVKYNIEHLDLDTLAWKDTTPPQREILDRSMKKINDFMMLNDNWIIEGGYADLLEKVVKNANEIIFLNLNESNCIDNCKKRPWESHKYVSKEAQDENLEMLLNWVKDYYVRDDSFSYLAHKKLFNDFLAKKSEYKNNIHYETL